MSTGSREETTGDGESGQARRVVRCAACGRSGHLRVSAADPDRIQCGYCATKYSIESIRAFVWLWKTILDWADSVPSRPLGPAPLPPPSRDTRRDLDARAAAPGSTRAGWPASKLNSNPESETRS